MYEGPGTYRHYKGGLYEVHGLAIREETKDGKYFITEVVYSPLSDGSILETMEETMWTRVLSNFNGLVLVENGGVQRFEKVDDVLLST
jgi:hypothetical protein